MYFKRLEMHGFKSFAEPVIIEFHEGITCVVGPNGSGKSNISDAIRWVLGEQSPKALRGGKMEEIIFNGTASRKSRGMAEVTLVIDNSMGILDIDYNEVAITRRMFRSGESEYLINNNQCRLRDIRELIMDTGIGVDGYSIIGQGKISDIVSNKPESRREIFEEAAGVVMYKSKKSEAERKLASTTNNMDRVNDIIGEIEGRIDSLREDSEKAREYLHLKERSKDLDINITLKNIDNINTKNETYRNDITELQNRIDDISNSKKSIDEEINSAREKNENLEQLANDSRDRLLRTVEEINKLSSMSQLNEERVSGIDKDNNRLKEEIKDLQEKLSKEISDGEELKKRKGEIAVEHKEASDLLQSRIEAFNKVTASYLLQSERIEEGKDKLFKLHSLISSKNSEVKSYESIMETLDRRKSQLEKESAGIEKNNADNDAQLKEAEVQKCEIGAAAEQIRNRLEEVNKQRNSLTEDIRRFNVTAEDLKIKGGQLTSRKRTIEEMENNYEGYNFAVKYIMKSGISGIEGVVAELMEVETGHEIAIETALGAAMQNIICTDDTVAKKAVNRLKENKAGRLTFLPVNSIKGSKVKVDRSIVNDSGYVGIASECIRFKPQYQNIFDYLLGRVAIVEDMDTAIRLSKLSGSSLRLVTLDGEIINVSGAITGGRHKNKTANLLERKSEITKLEDEISGIRSDLAKTVEEAKNAGAKLEQLKQESESLGEELRDKELTLASLGSMISAISDSVKEAADSGARYFRELASIDKELTEAEAAVTALKADILSAEKQIAAVNKSIERDMESFDTEKSQADSVSEEITKSRIAANELENRQNSIDDLLLRINETAEDYRFQIEDKQRQLSELSAEKDRLMFGSGDSEADVKALIKAKEDLEEYISRVSKERDSISEFINQVLKEQQKTVDNLNSYQDQKYQLEIKLAKNDTQLDTLKERLWEDFEISYAQALDFRKEDFVMSPSIKESRDIRNRIRELGEVNVGAIKEYDSVSRRYNMLTAQRSDIQIAMDELNSIIETMDRTIISKFKENFDQVVENFENIFRELFGGGHAELRMEDEGNPLESGIDIIAQPPGKKLQNINLMSGGEKTMTAIALMFAVLKAKPTPFCILDEIEAALDDNNIERFAKYLRKFTDIQFTLVTHQKATMEHADVLYGVTMPEQGISKVLSLRMGDNFEM